MPETKTKALILVIDDERDFRDIIRHHLSLEGYAVETAVDGGDGLRRFDELEPDLVILDGQLHDMDGLEVCRRLRATDGGRAVPILMCSVRAALPLVSDGFDAGASGYILKPFEREGLLEKVAEALASARAGE